MSFIKKTRIKKNQTKLMVTAVGFVCVSIFLAVLALSKVFYFRTIGVDVFHARDLDQEKEVASFVKSRLESDKNTFSQKNFFLFDKDSLEKDLRSHFEGVQKVDVHRTFNLSLFVSVDFYKPVFVGCVTDPEILISCMSAGEDGVFVKEAEGKSPGLYYMEIEKEALVPVDAGKEVEVDSIAETRLYDEAKMKTLFEFLKYFEKEGFVISKVSATGLGIITLHTEKFLITLSLDKGFANSIKEFEFVTKVDPLLSIIEKSELKKLDVSFKNKVFYTVKGSVETVSTTTASSTNLLETSPATEAAENAR